MEGQEEMRDFDFNSVEGFNLTDLNEVSEMQGLASETNPDNEIKENKTAEELAAEGVELTEEDKKLQEASSSHETKDSSRYTPYAKLAVEEGVLPNLNLEEFDGTPEGLIKGMQDEVNNGINQYKETLDPRIKWLADNVDSGVPLEDLLAVDKQKVGLEAIDETTIGTNPELQKEIAKNYYKETTKFSDSMIDKAIERLEAAGDLETESAEFFKELKVINGQKEEQLQQQAIAQQQEVAKAQEQAVAQFKADLEKIDEIVPGMKVNTGMKDKIFKGLTTAVDIDPATGQGVNEIQKAFVENPQLNNVLAYLWYSTDGFKDFKSLGISGKKAAVKEFDEALNNMSFTASTKQQIRRPGSQTLIDSIPDY